MVKALSEHACTSRRFRENFPARMPHANNPNGHEYKDSVNGELVVPPANIS